MGTGPRTSSPGHAQSGGTAATSPPGWAGRRGRSAVRGSVGRADTRHSALPGPRGGPRRLGGEREVTEAPLPACLLTTLVAAHTGQGPTPAFRGAAHRNLANLDEAWGDLVEHLREGGYPWEGDALSDDAQRAVVDACPVAGPLLDMIAAIGPSPPPLPPPDCEDGWGANPIESHDAPPEGGYPASAFYRITRPLSADQIRQVWERKACKAPVVDLPRGLFSRLASLLRSLLEDALVRNPRDPPPLSYVWALVTAGGADFPVQAARLRHAEKGDLLALFRMQSARSSGCPATRKGTAAHAARVLMSRGDVRKAVEVMGRPVGVRPRNATMDEIRAKFPDPDMAVRRDGTAAADDAQPAPSPDPDRAMAHPRRVRERATSRLNPQGRRCTWADIVSQAVAAPDWSSAAGPDGLRSAHLRQMVNVRGHGPLIMNALGMLVDRFITGRAADAFTSVALSMLPKGESWRPIGVGSVIRRIAMRIVAAQLKEDLHGRLESQGQLGLAEAGAQRAYLKAQACLDARCSLLKLDVANAYNGVERTAVLRAVAEVGDALRASGNPSCALAAAAALYKRPTEVHSRSGSFTSRRGVVQGCPVGSALYDLTHAAAMRAVADRLRAPEDGERGAIRFEPMGPLGTTVQYADNVVYHASLHDDIVLASRSTAALARARTVIAGVFAARGLSLAPGKAVVLGTQGNITSLASEARATRQAATLFAGAPLYVRTDEGQTEAGRLLFEYAIEKMNVVRNALKMENPQDLVRVLVSAGMWSRLSYSYSVTSHLAPWKTILPAADALSREGLAKALGPHARELGSIGWLVAVLKARYGGLGLPSCMIEAEVPGSSVYKALDSANDPADLAAGARAKLHKRREDTARALSGALRLACEDDPLMMTRLAHTGRRTSSNIWAINACARDHTLLGAKVASKVLHAKLLGNPTPAGRTYFCGEKMFPMPAVGSGSVEERHHLEICHMKDKLRHFLGVQALIAVADGVAPNAMSTEQSVDTFGSPCPPSGDHRRVPGDLVCNAGPRQWIYADLTVSTQIEDIRKERAPGSKYCMVLQAAKDKIAKYKDMFVGKESYFRPLAFSVYGGSSSLTNAALREIAQAVESQALASAPLGSTPLWIRFRDTIAVQIAATPAQHALELEEMNDAGAWTVDDRLPFHGDPQGDQRLRRALRVKRLADLISALLVATCERGAAEPGGAEGDGSSDGSAGSTSSDDGHPEEEGSTSSSHEDEARSRGATQQHCTVETDEASQRPAVLTPVPVPSGDPSSEAEGVFVGDSTQASTVAEQTDARRADRNQTLMNAQGEEAVREPLWSAGSGAEPSAAGRVGTAHPSLGECGMESDQEHGRPRRTRSQDRDDTGPRAQRASRAPPPTASPRHSSDQAETDGPRTGPRRADRPAQADESEPEPALGAQRQAAHSHPQLNELTGGSPPGRNQASARGSRSRRSRDRPTGGRKVTNRTRPPHVRSLHCGSNTDGDQEHESDAGDGHRPRPPRKKPRARIEAGPGVSSTDNALASSPNQASFQTASRCSLNQTGNCEPRIEASGAVDTCRTEQVDESEVELARNLQRRRGSTDPRLDEVADGGSSGWNREEIGCDQWGPGYGPEDSGNGPGNWATGPSRNVGAGAGSSAVEAPT